MKVKDLEIQRPFGIQPIDPFRKGTHHEYGQSGPGLEPVLLGHIPLFVGSKKNSKRIGCTHTYKWIPIMLTKHLICSCRFVGHITMCIISLPSPVWLVQPHVWHPYRILSPFFIINFPFFSTTNFAAKQMKSLHFWTNPSVSLVVYPILHMRVS